MTSKAYSGCITCITEKPATRLSQNVNAARNSG
ncbi:hypothetical protein RSAG8_13882, partial [Rhizoctonia solani AG-8 WAC10335]